MAQKRSYDILWAVSVVATALFWYCIYRAAHSEYDVNLAWALLGLLISILTAILIVHLVRRDPGLHLFKKVVSYVLVLAGTPLTLLLLFTYLQVFHMTLVYTGSYPGPYRVSKHRNYFKAVNTLAIEARSDTIVCVVLKDGTIEQLYRKNQGAIVNLPVAFLDSLSSRQIDELSKY